VPAGRGRGQVTRIKLIDELHKKMRLKQSEIDEIKKVVRDCFGNSSQVYLFGSRVDDSKKGGDIDLYIETESKDDIFEKKIRLLVELKKKLGERKIDVVINNFTNYKIIFDVAKNEGIPI
jgi:predicted nucleotidyltransferase